MIKLKFYLVFCWVLWSPKLYGGLLASVNIFNYLEETIEVKTKKSQCLEQQISTPIRVDYDSVEQGTIKASHSLTCFFGWAKQIVEVKVGDKVIAQVILQMRTSLLGLGGEIRGKVVKVDPNYEVYLYPGTQAVSVEEQSFWAMAVASRPSTP